MSTQTDPTTTFIRGGYRFIAGVYTAVSGIFEMATATYTIVKPVITATGATTYNITVDYVVPLVVSAGTTSVSAITNIVKGKPQPISDEPFDLHEEIEDDFVHVNNGKELRRIQRSASVSF